jgi:amino acid adenylation domain-containing protein
MSAVFEGEATLPLSPEQRALLSMGGAPASEALLRLRIAIEGDVDPQRLRAAVSVVEQAHEALGVSIEPVAGYRGLRMRPGAQARSLSVDVERTGPASQTITLAVNALVADRGSLAVIARDIAAAYRGDAPADAADRFQYPQYAQWRQELEQGEECEAGRAYWSRYRQQIGTLAAPRLAYRRRAALQAGSSRWRAERAIDAATARRVAAMAGDADPEVLLQAVWWLLLARLTRFAAFAGGWQHDCRRDYEVMQGAVGVFDKVLPLAITLSGDESFAEWLARIGHITREHMQSQEYWPVDAPPQDVHLAVGFAFHDAIPLGDSSWSVAERPGVMPCFELALQVDWSAAGGTLAVQADASLYSQPAVDRLLEQYATLLDSALSQPYRAVSELPCIGPQERSALAALRGADVDFGFGEQPLAARIAHWARQTPEAPAIESRSQRLSYRELDTRANRMAHWLQTHGVRPGTLVALELPRSPDLLVAILGAWRAGAGYLPLEPDWPVGRRHAVLADAQAALVLRAAPMDPEAPAPCAELRLADFHPDRFPATPPEHEAGLDDLAYVLYTSGSTGQPKGVVIAQRQLLNYVVAASQAMHLGGCRRWGLTSSVVADLGNTALFCAWFNGACVVVAERHEIEDAESFACFVGAGEVDALKMVPSHLDALLECDAPRLPRTLVLGGEPASGPLIERVARIAPHCAVYNHYGPTETTVGVMVHQVSLDPTVPDALPLSRVLANNRIHVLDAAMRPVPTGALGEVYIGGAQLCRGYLNCSADRDHAFVPDPFEPGEPLSPGRTEDTGSRPRAADAAPRDPGPTGTRLYRTGDLAHVLPEGGLRLVGRADHQVKIRGFRVELAEVEAALLAQPEVSQAVVLALPDAAGAPELVAFVVGDGEPEGEQGPRHWRARLAGVLPAHMLPARHVRVAAFPRLPNGKIDRLALRALAEDRSPAAPSTAACADAVEAAIAHCMATLLKRPAVGAGDDFFELGGHSLLAIKLAARLRKLFQVELAPGVVFDRRSAASLAAFLRQDPVAASTLQAQAEQALALAGEGAPSPQAPTPTVPDPDGIHVVHGRGNRTPLFCLPGLFASALEYRAILDALPADRPVHSFVCHTLTRARWQHWRMEELAAGYSRYIAETVGRGPVALLGWSVGGDVAFEVARQLTHQGLGVRFVGLLDVMLPAATQLRVQADDVDADGAVDIWMERSSMRDRWRELYARLDNDEKRLATRFLREQVISSPPDGDATDAAEYRAWARVNHGAMMRRHAWRHCGVPAYVWRAHRSVVHAPTQSRDWRTLADVRREEVVPGCDHRTLLDDRRLARDLAAQLLAFDL